MLLTSAQQANAADYGIDYEGPVPLDNDEDEIVVPDLPHLLSEPERALLRQQLVEPSTLTHDQAWMIQNYVVARTVVYSCVE